MHIGNELLVSKLNDPSKKFLNANNKNNNTPTQKNPSYLMYITIPSPLTYNACKWSICTTAVLAYIKRLRQCMAERREIYSKKKKKEENITNRKFNRNLWKAMIARLLKKHGI